MSDLDTNLGGEPFRWHSAEALTESTLARYAMSDDFTIQKAVQFAVATEDMAATAYSELAKMFSEQKEISEAFSLLEADEKSHRTQFKSLLNRLPPEDDNVLEGEKHLYLSAMARSEFFAGEAGMAAILEKSQTLVEALVHVLDFEKATLGFYRAIQDTLAPEAAIDAIIAAEKQHIARLMKYILTDEKVKGLADDS